MAIPCHAKGEAAVMIDGEQRIIKFSLSAQVRIQEALELDQLEEVPMILHAMNPHSLAQMISASLIGDPMTVEQLMECSIPTHQAALGIVQAMNLAMFGTIDGPDVEEDDEGKEETRPEVMM